MVISVPDKELRQSQPTLKRICPTTYYVACEAKSESSWIQFFFCVERCEHFHLRLRNISVLDVCDVLNVNKLQ